MEKEGGKGATSLKAESLCSWCTLSQSNSPTINNSVEDRSADSHHEASVLQPGVYILLSQHLLSCHY